MSRAVAEAPGKILLIGEHSVVYGHPAVAIPMRGVRARAEAELTRGGAIEMIAPDLREKAASDGKSSPQLAPLLALAGTVMEFFGEQRAGLRVTLHSTIPLGRGMGSGAAISVALVRAICAALGRKLAPDQEAELAMEAEKEFHGSPSGVDTAVVSRDEPIYFVKGKPPQPIAVGSGVFRFVAADTGIISPTVRVVEEVAAAREKERARFDAHFWELGSMASVAREVIRSGEPAELGICMNHAQGILREVGVSSPEIETLVEAALQKGALGAKLSGAGRGGIMIALLDEDADEERFINDMRLAGAEDTYTTVLGGE